jgi:hypothetical protein
LYYLGIPSDPLIDASDAHCEIIYHDPNDGGDLTTQSPINPRKEFLVEEKRNLEGDEVTVPRFGNSTNPFRFIDGFVVIVPFFALTDPNAGVLTYYQSNLKTLEIETKSLPLPFAGRGGRSSYSPRAAEGARDRRG